MIEIVLGDCRVMVFDSQDQLKRVLRFEDNQTKISVVVPMDRLVAMQTGMALQGITPGMPTPVEEPVSSKIVTAKP